VLNADEAQRYQRTSVSIEAPWELSGLGQLHDAVQAADRLICFGGA
jgi:tRNA 2-thiouridine synthesizing protein D